MEEGEESGPNVIFTKFYRATSCTPMQAGGHKKSSQSAPACMEIALGASGSRVAAGQAIACKSTLPQNSPQSTGYGSFNRQAARWKRAVHRSRTCEVSSDHDRRCVHRPPPASNSSAQSRTPLDYLPTSNRRMAKMRHGIMTVRPRKEKAGEHAQPEAKAMGTARAFGNGDAALSNPVLKSLIDNVIVPALIEEWKRSRVPTMAA